MAFDLGEALKGVSELDTGREQIEYIRLDLIDEDPNNFYQLSDIDELAVNIELCGLQQPIRVRPILDTDRYMIVSGHRRRKAIEALTSDNPQKWAEIPCIVERDDISPALQQLRLIYANANTRKMTPSEVSDEAAKIKELLYELKEAGYEFPGRMRDHVAEIVKVSKSKLARLEVIRKDLAAAWKPSWKNGTLSENTAYELAKMPKAYQTLLFEEKTRTNANLRYLHAYSVKCFAGRASAIEKMKCKAFSGDCDNFENKLRKAAVSDQYGFFHCDNKCCRDCPELLRCQKACPKLKDTIKQLKADAKAAAKQEAAAKAEKNRPAVEQISALWQRFGLCREMAYKEIEDCKKALGIYYFPYDEDKTMKLECGEAKISPETKLPFGYSCYLPEINRLVALADMFGVSLDYLLCRTDIKEMAQESATVSETVNEASTPAYIPGAWYPVSVEPPVGVRLVLIDSEWFTDTGKYIGCGEYTMDYGAPVAYWTLEPDPTVASTSFPGVTGWHGGTPEHPDKYAAYVRVEGCSGPILRELYWNGEWWSMHNERIADEVTVMCWMERPEV